MTKRHGKKRQSSSAATGSQPASRISSPIGSERPFTSNSFHGSDLGQGMEDVQQRVGDMSVGVQSYSQEVDQGELQTFSTMDERV